MLLHRLVAEVDLDYVYRNSWSSLLQSKLLKTPLTALAHSRLHVARVRTHSGVGAPKSSCFFLPFLFFRHEDIVLISASLLL